MGKELPTEVIKNYIKIGALTSIVNHWSEPHRFFHRIETHLDPLFIKLKKYKDHVNELEWDALVLAGWFHDICYQPGSTDNEERSVELMKSYVAPANTNQDVVLDVVKKIILSTKDIEPKDGIFEIFRQCDCGVLIDSDFGELLDYEDQIFKEFQKYPWETYRSERLKFLHKSLGLFPENMIPLGGLINYVQHRKPNIGVYAGSFNPFHVGHLDVLEQAEDMFDKVVVAFGKNPEKSDHVITVPKSISNREVITYSGMLVSVLTDLKQQGCNVTLIRGLRNEYDLNYEQNLVQYIKDQMPTLKVVFFLCDKKYEHISSGAIRALNKIDSESTIQYLVP